MGPVDVAGKVTEGFIKVPEGSIGFIDELPGANTQGDTLDEARANLCEVVAVALAANRELYEAGLEGQVVVGEELRLTGE